MFKKLPPESQSEEVSSLEKLKELFSIDFDYATKLLTHPEVRDLAKTKKDLQKILSFKVDVPFLSFGGTSPTSVPANFFIGNLPLNILLEFLRYPELRKLIDPTFVLNNIQLLVKSLEDYQLIIKKNTNLALFLASTDHVAKLFDIQLFYQYASSKSSLDKELALELAKSPYISNRFKHEKQFLAFAAINPSVAKALLNHPAIAAIADKVKHQIDFEHFLHAFPVIPAREMKQLSIARLDLALPPIPQKKQARHESHLIAEITENTSKKAKEIAAKQFMTIRSYFDHMMFGGKSGYYSSGRVDFAKDFQTFASNAHSAKALAGAFAYQLLMTRQKLIASHELSATEPFNVLEGGAGNGNLCFNILSMIKDMAESDDPLIAKEWKGLHETISYHIVERSPELVKTQTLKNQAFIDANKLKIVNADAKYLTKALPGKKMAAVISNELLDVFPPQYLTMNKNGNIDIDMILPKLEKNVWQTAKELFTEEDFKKITAELEKNSERNINLIQVTYKDFQPQSNKLYLSKQDFYKLHEILVDKQKFETAFSFAIFQLSGDYFVRVKEFIAQNKSFFARMQPGETVLVTIGMDNFIKNAANILMTNGEIISVDYGNNGYSIDKRLRTYSNSKLGFNFFEKPGYKDMTYDVNFTDMVNRSKAFGIELLYFGNQAHMLPETIYFPENILSRESRRFFSTHPSSADFKVCVQYKSSPSSLLETKVHSEERFAEPSQLVTYSELFNDYKKGLTR